MCMRRLVIFLFLVLCTTAATIAQTNVKRVILFGIDGLHWEAPDKLNMPVFNSLIDQGTYIQKSYMIVPHHPKIGDYSQYNSCSFPNPVLHQGTIFLNPDNKMIQEVFSPGEQTAFVVNTTAYRSVGRGFSTSVMDADLSDDQVVEQAMKIMKTEKPVFMRIHLQTPGSRGYDISQSTPDKPYFRNIYGTNSPYIEAVENADKLLGKFVSFLKQSGLWNETVFIVTSDHGQCNMGWHPLFEEESWMTPLLFVGQGIAQGRRLSYFEHTDLAPTIAGLLGKDAPNRDGGAGIAIKAIMENSDPSGYHPNQYIKTLNQQIKEYNFLKAKMILASEDDHYFSIIIALLDNSFSSAGPFNDQDKILDWSKAGNTVSLVETNEKILEKMRQLFTDQPPESNLQLTLPPRIYCSQFSEVSIYYENIIYGAEPADYSYKVTPELGKGDSIKYTFDIQEKSSREFNLTVDVFNKSGRKVAGESIIVCYSAAENIPTDTMAVLITGNSLTNAGYFPAKVKSLFQDSLNFPMKFLGTKQSNGGVHEGYGGKTWEWFSQNMDSPFVFSHFESDTTLNFKNYFENVVKAVPDFVVIELGINDCFRADTTSIEAIDSTINEMFKHVEYYITKLIDYKKDIQIGICLPPAPNSRNAAFMANYEDKYTQTGWTKIERRLAQKYIAYFSNHFQSNCSVIPLGINIDTSHGYPVDNAVHPNKSGYHQLASSIFNWLLYQSRF